MNAGWDRGRTLAIASFFAAGAASGAWWVALRNEQDLEPVTLIYLAAPVVAAAIPVFLRGRRGLASVIAAPFLLLVCLFGAASIGLFYLPSAWFMAFSAGNRPAADSRESSGVASDGG